MKLAIIDIDQTIADCSHRAHYVDRPKKQQNWKKFLDPEAVILDRVVAGAEKGIGALMDHGFQIVYMTGRDERLRAATELWLQNNIDPDASYDNPVYMRAFEDRRVASVVKSELLTKIYDRYKPQVIDTVLAFDDDWHMKDVYRAHDILWFKAPECWQTLAPDPPQPLGTEIAWRK